MIITSNNFVRLQGILQAGFSREINNRSEIGIILPQGNGVVFYKTGNQYYSIRIEEFIEIKDIVNIHHSLKSVFE